MFGGKKKGDPRVREILDSENIKYVVDDDGHFKITFAYDDNRSQLVFINSNTENFAGVELREIWSVGLKGNGQLSAEVANKLLERNGRYKVGSWEITKQSGQVMASFKVVISANADKSELMPVVQMVGIQADEVEKEFLLSDFY
ncbi:YbjN domain-containing protein [Desulfobulbus propionicus]